MNGLRKHRGVTLVELLVVVAIIAMLAAITLPALRAARNHARTAQSKSNLRQLGVGLQTFADRDPQGRFCTGAYDLRRDGCPDTWGWVADLVPLRVVPGELLNPTSSYPGIEQFQSMLSAASRVEGIDGCPNQRLADGACGKNVEWDDGANDYTGDLFDGTGADSQQRAAYLGQHLLDKGYNTNYVPSWYLVRGTIRVEQVIDNNQVEWWFLQGASDGDTRGLSATTGPLTTRTVDNSFVPSGHIPLLGEGAPGGLTGSLLFQEIPGLKQESLPSGARLSKSFNPGPSRYDSGNDEIVRLPPNTEVTDQVRHECYEDNSAPNTWLQDTRGWYAVNGSTCNILMADGSVKEFKDQDNDGLLNPGFPIPPGGGGSGVGYQSGTVELPPREIYSGVFLEPVRPRL
jgi:prepilin-type N-terminal cleavage/methylation domain-containing protein/prepilin-type processing-associated H-X9-DG protein